MGSYVTEKGKNSSRSFCFGFFQGEKGETHVANRAGIDNYQRPPSHRAGGGRWVTLASQIGGEGRPSGGGQTGKKARSQSQGRFKSSQ